MQSKTNLYLPLIFGFLIIGGLIVFWPAPPVNAQCGSQASSCKNCHEVQGQDPVNNDGTGWHESHAFGDFCEFCHAGNVQSLDKDEAHTGMVAPLEDVQASCASCHPADLMEKAEVYASILGVEAGTGGGSRPSTGSDAGETTGGNDTGESSPADSPPAGALIVDDAEVIDYNQRYDETVLGKRTINWGNLIVTAMIVLVAGGGGGFVIWNERRLRAPEAVEVSNPPDTAKQSGELPGLNGYPDEILLLMPKIAKLNPVGLHALKRLLDDPEEASELLHSLSRLDPELVRTIRRLDRDSRALLLALSGD